MTGRRVVVDWACTRHPDGTIHRTRLILRKPPKIPLLTVLISSSAIAYNLFLPSMPDIGLVFGVSIFTVQSTLIAFLVAYALAQFFYGGVSDRFGRRPTLLWGLAIYVIASLLCAISPIFIFNVGLAMTFPNVMAAAVSVRPEYAGTAAAMNGLMQYGMAAITTLIVGLLPHVTHLPLAWVIFLSQLAAFAASIVGWRARPQE